MRELILSAGMDVKGSGTSAGIPAAPGPVAATTGDQPGEIDLTWPRLSAAKSFVIQHATAADAADADWKFATTSTRSSCSVTGLSSGTRYWFRVAATASAGLGHGVPRHRSHHLTALLLTPTPARFTRAPGLSF